MIPSRCNRKNSGYHDKYLYGEQNLVERVFQKLKHSPRIATRYERLVISHMAMMCLVSTLFWLN